MNVQAGDQGEKQNGQAGDQGEKQNGQTGDQGVKKAALPSVPAKQGQLVVNPAIQRKLALAATAK